MKQAGPIDVPPGAICVGAIILHPAERGTAGSIELIVAPDVTREHVGLLIAALPDVLAQAYERVQRTQ